MTRKNKLGSYVTFQDAAEEEELEANLKAGFKILRKNVRNESKGKHLFDSKIEIGRRGDDLVLNQLTIVFQAFWIKKPSFINPNYNRNNNRNQNTKL